MKIQVIKPFTLLHDDGTEQKYAVGVHDVPEIVADHWYTKLHVAAEEVAEKIEEKVEELLGKPKQKAPADASGDKSK